MRLCLLENGLMSFLDEVQQQLRPARPILWPPARSIIKGLGHLIVFGDHVAGSDRRQTR